MTSVIFNGTGSSTGVPQLFCSCEVCSLKDPRNRRTRFSVTIIERETVLQVDFPFELRQQLLKSGIDHITGAWLTHPHSDHLSGIDDLRMASFRNGTPLPFFLNRETYEIASVRYPYLFFENEYIPRPFLRPVILDGSPVALDDLNIIPIRHMHGELVVSSLRIGDFALVADISSIEENEFKKLAGVRTLAIAATVHKVHPRHFNLHQVIEFIDKVSPDQAYLTHMNHTFDYEETLSLLPNGVVPATDGLRIEI